MVSQVVQNENLETSTMTTSPSRNPENESLIAEHVAWMTVSRFSATTIRERARLLRTVPFVLPGTMPDAMAWLAERSVEVHANSLVKIAGSLKGFAKGWAEMNDEPNPLARLPWPKGTQAPPGRIADEAAIEKLIRSLQAKSSFVRGTKLEQARALRDLLIVRLLFITGARRGEIAKLHISDVDMSANPPTLLMRDTKNNTTRSVPVSRTTADGLTFYLFKRWAFPCARIVPNLFVSERGALTSNGIGQMLKTRCVEAGVPNVTAHQFRRLMAHRWIDSGLPIDSLAATCGWSTLAMPYRYAAERVNIRASRDHQQLMESRDITD